MNGRVLGVDPGDVRIGLAISDPGGQLARPYKIIRHVSRKLDAALIAAEAQENGVGLIVFGMTYDDEGSPTAQGRKAARLAEELRAQTSIPVVYHDEDFSTLHAQNVISSLFSKSKQKKMPSDDHAAAVMLQDYLDSHTGGAGKYNEQA